MNIAISVVGWVVVLRSVFGSLPSQCVACLYFDIALPMEMMQAKCLVYGSLLCCIEPVLTVVAYVSAI